MAFTSATMTKRQLREAVEAAVNYPHKHVHRGELILSPEVFTTPGRETNLVISRFARIDCTGSVRIGPWCNIGHRSRIYTHDTIHLGRAPLARVEEACGVRWQDKQIGADVWIHDGAMVLYQVTHIPDGVVIGARSVLTRNPGPYEIWAGVPARKIGEREAMEMEAIRGAVNRNPFRLPRDFDGRDPAFAGRGRKTPPDEGQTRPPHRQE